MAIFNLTAFIGGFTVAIMSFVPTSVNVKLLMPSTGYLRDLHITENSVASSQKLLR